MSKFFRTTITLEILSEGPFEFDDLHSVNWSITQGDCSGRIVDSTHEEITEPELVALCDKHHTDPEFFGVAIE